jgi:hypothetical protein
LLFQTSTGSTLSKAIDKVTQIAGTQGYVHAGMAVCSSSVSNITGERQDRGAMYVIEAIDEGVCLTPLDSFLTRTCTKVYRLQKEYQALIFKAIEYSIRQLGKPYDSAYLPDTNKFYCSELIVEAFRYANNGKQFFETAPMTFKLNGEFLPEWVEWYKQLGTAIPEGVQGSNPTALSRDKRLIRL